MKGVESRAAAYTIYHDGSHLFLVTFINERSGFNGFNSWLKGWINLRSIHQAKRDQRGASKCIGSTGVEGLLTLCVDRDWTGGGDQETKKCSRKDSTNFQAHAASNLQSIGAPSYGMIEEVQPVVRSKALLYLQISMSITCDLGSSYNVIAMH